MKIEVFTRNVYGSQMIYPSCDQAKRLAAFAGCRTFSALQLSLLREAGIQVDQVPDPRAVLPT